LGRHPGPSLRRLAGLVAQSEVTISYCPPPDGTDAVATETFQNANATSRQQSISAQRKRTRCVVNMYSIDTEFHRMIVP
jgi:hypothetical protein